MTTKELDLTGQQLTAFPDSLDNLPDLEVLYLDQNRFTTLFEIIVEHQRILLRVS